MDDNSTIFNLFTRNRELFNVTHKLHSYMFLSYVGDDKVKSKILHMVLGEGFIYDYHSKHICLNAPSFWDAMELRLSNIEGGDFITNGDILYLTNYIYTEGDKKVTQILLTNPVGVHKSQVFFVDDTLYDAVKTFDPNSSSFPEIG